MPNIGPLELAIVLVIALLIFGPRKLPELGRNLGRGMREFKASVTGSETGDESEDAPRKLSAPSSVAADPSRGAAPTETARRETQA